MPSNTNFVHLHVHSDYSLLQSIVSIKELVSKAASMGMKHLALTDSGNMFGVPEFVRTCREANINPIIWSEFYMTSNSWFDKTESTEGKYYHFILLVSNEEGYHNLVKLSSLSFFGKYYQKPYIDSDLLFKHTRGLIGLSTCFGKELPSQNQEVITQVIRLRALHFRKIMGNDNFFLKLHDHKLKTQKEKNTMLADISKMTGIPLVATNDIHYLNKEDSSAHDILLFIAEGTTEEQQNRLRFESNEYYFKSSDEMAEIFKNYHEAIANTIKIAKRCNVDIPSVKIKNMPRYLPEFEIPAGFPSSKAYLYDLTMKGLEKRHNGNNAAKKRAEYELEIINGKGFSDYFLIVADYINWAREHGIPVGPGRGSAPSSIVAYALGITGIDPIRYNIPFERFINPDQDSMPDIDIDFSYEDRDRIIDYIKAKYGQNRVGHIVTLYRLGAREAIRNTGQVLNMFSEA